YDKRYVATPLVAPDFAALANAFGIRAERVTARSEVVPAIRAARQSAETVLIDFRVEQEDSVYPMVPAGASLHDMIRHPNNPLVETAAEPYKIRGNHANTLRVRGKQTRRPESGHF